MGHQFLRHVERTRLLIHVIDMAGSEGRDPIEDWRKINAEMKAYSGELAERPQIIAANKMDLPDAEELLSIFQEEVGPNVPIYPVSAATRQGLRELIFAAADRLDQIPEPTPAEEVEERIVYRPRMEEEPFTIRRENEVYVVEGARVEKLVQMTNFNYDDSILRFAQTIKRMGVEDALRKKGAKDGDTVRIGEVEFELTD